MNENVQEAGFAHLVLLVCEIGSCCLALKALSFDIKGRIILLLLFYRILLLFSLTLAALSTALAASSLQIRMC